MKYINLFFIIFCSFFTCTATQCTYLTNIFLVSNFVWNATVFKNAFPLCRALLYYLEKKPDIIDIPYLTTEQFREISLERIKELIKADEDSIAKMYYVATKLINRFGKSAPLKCAYVLELLFKEGLQPFDFMDSIFYILIRHNCIEIIRYFLEKNVHFVSSRHKKNVFIRDLFLDDKNEYLLKACKWSCKEIVELFVRSGMSVREKLGFYEKTLIQEAISNDDENLILFLINNGALVDYETQEYAAILSTIKICAYIEQIINFEQALHKKKSNLLNIFFKNVDLSLIERIHYIEDRMFGMYLYTCMENNNKDEFEKTLKKWTFCRPKELIRKGYPLNYEDYKNKQALALFAGYKDVLLNYIVF